MDGFGNLKAILRAILYSRNQYFPGELLRSIKLQGLSVNDAIGFHKKPAYFARVMRIILTQLSWFDFDSIVLLVTNNTY
jgi:hypothetical protein